jgi:hypothetical protein
METRQGECGGCGRYLPLQRSYCDECKSSGNPALACDCGQELYGCDYCRNPVVLDGRLLSYWERIIVRPDNTLSILLDCSAEGVPPDHTIEEYVGPDGKRQLRYIRRQ